MKADASRQLRLLDLQAIDTRLDQIDHARTHLPQIAELRELEGEETSVRSDVVRAETDLGDIRREVDKSEADVQLVRDRAARDSARLEAGSGSAKDLQALQHEMTSLERRQSELEDVELEVMERGEAAETEVARLTARHEELSATVAEVTSQHDSALADLDREAADVARPRPEVVGEVGEDLVALYEKIRGDKGGVGAAALSQRRCGGCQLELNKVEINQIAAAAPDEVVRCEECRRILVRTPESGLPA